MTQSLTIITARLFTKGYYLLVNNYELSNTEGLNKNYYGWEIIRNHNAWVRMHNFPLNEYVIEVHKLYHQDTSLRYVCKFVDSETNLLNTTFPRIRDPHLILDSERLWGDSEYSPINALEPLPDTVEFTRAVIEQNYLLGNDSIIVEYLANAIIVSTNLGL